MSDHHPVSRSFGASPRVVPRPEYPSFWIPLFYQFKSLFVTIGYGMLLLYLLHDSVWVRSIIFFQDQFDLKDEALIFTILVTAYHTAIYLMCNIPFFLMDKYNWYQEYKLHRNEHALPTEKLITETLVTAFVSQAITSPVLSYLTYSLFKSGGMTSNLSPLPGLQEQFFHLALQHLFQDIVFYITHRAFHSKALYWIHKQHHSYAGTMSISAEYANPIEVVVANIFPTLGGLPLLAGNFHPHVLLVWMVLRLQQTYFSHSGYAFIGTFLDYAGLAHADAAVFHDHHHTSNQGNFGNYFLDYSFGTLDHFAKNGFVEGYLNRKSGKSKDI